METFGGFMLGVMVSYLVFNWRMVVSFWMWFFTQDDYWLSFGDK